MPAKESPQQESFLKLYNEVHKLLSEKFFGQTDKYVSFSRCVDEIANHPGNAYLNDHIEELRLINDFRNLIVHRTTEKFYDIAEPSDTIMDILSHIRNLLANPVKISDFVDDKSLITFDLDDDLWEVFNQVSRGNISQFPVFDGQKLVGMITDNGLTNFIANHLEQKDFGSQTHCVRDIIEDEKTDEYKYAYRILYQGLDLEACLDAFTDLKQTAHYILVTQAKDNTLNSKGDLLDIFTAADIPQMLNLLDNQ